MFKIMVCGVSHDITKIVQKLKNSPNSSRIELYKKLTDKVYEQGEYRMSLWLPLALKEKLDMIMHQRIEGEIEIMVFLLDQEYELQSNIGNSDKIDLALERSLDSQIFVKYQNGARL